MGVTIQRPGGSAAANVSQIEQDIRLSYLKTAENRNRLINMIDGIADPYVDESGVNTGSSSNITHHTAPVQVTTEISAGAGIGVGVTNAGASNTGHYAISAATSSLVSANFTADFTPDTARVLLIVGGTDAATLTVNTDLVAKISRNGGTNQTTATLQKIGETEQGYQIFEASNEDISAQPSGTSMQYEIETANTTVIDIHGVVFHWGNTASGGAGGGGGGVTDHGALTGLSDDDHTQYHTDGRADTWLGTKDSDDIAEGATNLYMSAAEQTKLSGIETGADVTDATNVNAAGAVMESDFNAQTILIAVSDNTPTALTVTASTFVGRKATGNVGIMSAAEARTVLNVEDGADVTDETNVTNALDGATLTDVGTPAAGDLVLLQDASDSNNLKVAQFSTFGGGGSTDLKPYCVTGTGSDIPAAATVQDLSTEQVTDANYSLSTDQITVTDAGTYLISYSIQIDEDGTAGGTRGRVSAYMEADNVIIPQSYSAVYTREASGGTGLSASFIVELSASDVLELYTDQDGTAIPDMSAERTQVLILKVA